jgi:leucyl/phenylalanyl-tRNA--protein transferase
VRPLPSPLWQLPDPRDGQPGDDVVALGGDLDPGTVLHAYARGMFPMHLDDTLAWWSPDPRGILPLDAVRISDSLRSSMRRYRCTIDTDFEGVIRGCADPARPKGWITPEITAAYVELHALGFAHSVETWDHDGELVGGLYGVEIGGLFAGESMFHRARDASKVALVHLVATLTQCPGARLLDVQWRTDHLASLGVVDVPRDRYLAMLAIALASGECLSRG